VVADLSKGRAVQGDFFCHPLAACDIPQVPSNLALIAQ
jgi:hypothetical protein